VQGGNDACRNLSILSPAVPVVPRRRTYDGGQPRAQSCGYRPAEQAPLRRPTTAAFATAKNKSPPRPGR